MAQKQTPLLAKLGLSDWQWALLSKELEKEASTMLHGLEKLEVLERQTGKASVIVA
jgi:hypothetical protein